MSEIREIVTRAVVAKGKKLLKIKENITPSNETFSVLGCWIINHEFEALLSGKKVDVNGNFEIDVWYSYDNNTKTDIARTDANYCETIKVRELICDNVSDHCDVIARVIQQPTCTNACITDEGIEVEIVDMVYHHRELPIGAIGMGADMDVVLSHNRRCKKHQQRE